MNNIINYQKMEIITNSRVLVSMPILDNRITVETKIKKKRVFLAADMIRLIAHYLPYKELVNLVTIKKSVYDELVKTYGSNLYNVSRIYEFSCNRDGKIISEHYPKNALIHIDAIRTVILKSTKLIGNWKNINNYSVLQNLVLENNLTLCYINIPILRVNIIKSSILWGQNFASALQYINTDSNFQMGECLYPNFETIKFRGKFIDMDINYLPVIKYIDAEVYDDGKIHIHNLDKLDHDMNYVRLISNEEHTNRNLLTNGELIYSDGDCRKYRNVKINGYNINIVCISN